MLAAEAWPSTTPLPLPCSPPRPPTRDGLTLVGGVLLGDIPNPANPGTLLSSAGRVCVFTRPNPNSAANADWTRACIAPPQPATNAYFGYSVSLSSNGAVLAVGANQDDEGSSTTAGSAWIFNKESGGWVLKQRLVPVPVSGTIPEEFGRCVSLDGAGTALAVGASWTDVSPLTAVGAAYAFQYSY